MRRGQSGWCSVLLILCSSASLAAYAIRLTRVGNGMTLYVGRSSQVATPLSIVVVTEMVPLNRMLFGSLAFTAKRRFSPLKSLQARSEEHSRRPHAGEPPRDGLARAELDVEVARPLCPSRLLRPGAFVSLPPEACVRKQPMFPAQYGGMPGGLCAHRVCIKDHRHD